MIQYTPLPEAKDTNGQTLKPGDVCIYVGDADGFGGRRGNKVVIRAIKAPRLDKYNSFAAGPRKGQPKPGFPNTTIELRVDDDVDGPDERDQFGWSAWLRESELVLFSAAAKAADQLGLRKLGGRASIREIYDVIEPNRPTENRFWQEKIRQTLQRHFKPIERGVWALTEAA